MGKNAVTTWLALVLLALGGAPGCLAGPPSAFVAEQMHAAVAGLKDKVPLNTRIGVDNLTGDADHLITDHLVTAMTEQGYRVFDRRSLEKIFKQHGVEMRAAFDQESVRAIGTIPGVDGILYGAVRGHSGSFGASTLQLHLQYTPLGGYTVWARDIDARTGSGLRVLALAGAGLLAALVLVLVYRGFKNAGKTRVLD